MKPHTDQTIGSALQAAAAVFPDRPAVIDPTVSYSYAELDRMADRMARYYLSCGVGKGDHVGIVYRDCAAMLVQLYGIWRIGAVAVPLCTSYTEAELVHCIRTADIQLLILGSSQTGESYARLLDCSRFPVPVVPMDLLTGDLIQAKSASVPLCVLEQAKRAVRPEDPDTILFTSGTTGPTKPVLTTHASRVATLQAQAQVLSVEPTDRFCSALPMYHCFSLTATVLAAMAAGACVVFPADRHTRTILQAVETHRCTILTAVPTLFSALIRRLETESYDLSSLKKGMIGGSSYTEEFFCRVSERLGLVLVPSLGQTEATAGITSASVDDPLEVRARTIGRFFPGVEGCIKDIQTGGILPPGQEGEICVRGYNVMQGYYKQPEATAAVIDKDGWLHSGDLGKLDRQGYVCYTGRLKELIIRGGENIAPSEIEALLLADSRIRSAKVVGVPDPHYTEEICACVVPASELSAEEVRSIVRQRAAYFKIPRYVLFFRELPMTSVGKIDVKALRKLAAEQFGGTP